MSSNNNIKRSKVKCCVHGCGNYASKTVSVHRFPHDPHLKNAWKEKLKINRELPLWSVVCGDHFIQSDYFNSNINYYHKQRIKQFLKPTSIPSRNLPTLIDSKFVKKKKPKPKYIDSDYTTDDTADTTTDDSDCERVTSIKQIKCKREDDIEPDNTKITDNFYENTNNEIDCLDHEIDVIEVVGEENEKEPKPITLIEMTEIEFIDVINTEEDRVEDSSNSTRSVLENIYTNFIRTEQELCICTGVNSFQIFESIVNRFVSSTKHFMNIYLTDADCVIMALMKLKQNITVELLSVMFRCPNVKILSFLLRQTFSVLTDCLSWDVYWLDRDDIRKALPSCFLNELSSVRAIFYSIEIEIPNTQNDHNDVINKCKFLISVTPSGIVTFVSPGYCGGISDKSIFIAQQLYSKFDSEIDAIMFKNEFDTTADPEFNENMIKVLSDYTINEFFSDEFEQSEIRNSDYISKAKKYNDYVIERIKSFEILKQRLEPYCLTQIDKLLFLICAISNLNLREVKTETLILNM